MKVTTLRDFAS